MICSPFYKRVRFAYFMVKGLGLRVGWHETTGKFSMMGVGEFVKYRGGLLWAEDCNGELDSCQFLCMVPARSVQATIIG